MVVRQPSKLEQSRFDTGHSLRIKDNLERQV